MNSADFKSKLQKKWVLAFLAVFGISLISSGVFAASRITLNSGGAVNLGAGTAPVTACQTQATVSALQTLGNDSVYKLTTIDLDLNTDNCLGKTLGLAFIAGGTSYSTTWSIGNTGGARTFTYGGLNIDSANSNISTIAVSAQ
jgi:hypothetical protein